MVPGSPSPPVATSCARAVGAQVPARSVPPPATTCLCPSRCAQRRRFSSRAQWLSPSNTSPRSHRCGGSRWHRRGCWWTCTRTELGGRKQSWRRPERNWERGGGSWSHFARRLWSCAACSSPRAGAGAAVAAPPVPPPHSQSLPSPAGSSAAKWSAACPHWSPPSPAAPQDGSDPSGWDKPWAGTGSTGRALLCGRQGASAPGGIQIHDHKG
ncbi:RING finger protein 212B isoform X5 [Prinia subflava]|uniref:RING finger protein 212B isoform X5 n=1 Tax=Prinia subflava TaxID=208062 RepID=UPI002FDF8779